MRLNEFIHFNQRCPVCDNDLTLYLQMKDSVCFRARKMKKNIYHFEPYKLVKNSGVSERDYIDLFDYGTDTETKFSSSQMAAEAKRRSMYFFFLCRDAGFEEEHGDYNINIYPGCYFRSTPFLEYQKEGKSKRWNLKTINPDLSNLINQDEALSFTKTNNGVEKIYMLQMDGENNKTIFMHYAVNEEQKKDKDYSPNVFEREMPPLTVRPNFSQANRERLLDRFDSWVIIS
jgi:hypothetical protein